MKQKVVLCAKPKAIIVVKEIKYAVNVNVKKIKIFQIKYKNKGKQKVTTY